MPWKNKGNGQVQLKGQIFEWCGTIDHFFNEDQKTHPNLKRGIYYLITAFLLTNMAVKKLPPEKFNKVKAMWASATEMRLAPGKTVYDVLDYLADETDQMFLFHWLTDARSVIVETTLQNS